MSTAQHPHLSQRGNPLSQSLHLHLLQAIHRSLDLLKLEKPSEIMESVMTAPPSRQEFNTQGVSHLDCPEHGRRSRDRARGHQLCPQQCPPIRTTQRSNSQDQGPFTESLRLLSYWVQRRKTRTVPEEKILAKPPGSEGEGKDGAWLSNVCVITVCGSWTAGTKSFWLHQGA